MACPHAGLLLMALLPGRAFPDYPIETIELRARTLDEVLPVVRPLIGPESTLTGMGNHLVIKAPPEEVSQVRALLKTLDVPPRRLMIHVTRGAVSSGSFSGYRAGADIEAGDGRVTINSPGYSGEGSHARLDLVGREQDTARHSGYRVAGVEGRPALVGSSNVSYAGMTGGGVYVVPRITGDNVSMEVWQHESRSGPHGMVATQGSGSFVHGRLGEWISLGAIDTGRQSNSGGLATSSSSSGSSLQQISVLVECLDCEGPGAGVLRGIGRGASRPRE